MKKQNEPRERKLAKDSLKKTQLAKKEKKKTSQKEQKKDNRFR